MQLDKLWQFMQVDTEADRFEEKIRQSEKRQKLIKQRNFLMEQQNNMKKLESEIAAMSDRLEAVEDDSKRLEQQLATLSQELESNPPQSPEEVETRLEPIQKLTDSLSRYEQEISKMHKDADVRDRQQKEIRVRAAKTKVEYDQLKQDYDVEFKRDTAQLKEMRKNTEAEAKKVEPELLAKYKSIKQHQPTPMAKLINDQCSGCFMSLPSATLLDIRNGGKLVLCDNCGRILYFTE